MQKTTAIIAVALSLLVLATPASAQAITSNQACLAASVGCTESTMYATVMANQCGKQGDGVYRCPVTFSLYVTVTGVAVCGDASSSVTNGRPPACAVAGTAAAASPATGTQYYEPGELVYIRGETCVWTLSVPDTKSCRPFDYYYAVPESTTILDPDFDPREVVGGTLGDVTRIVDGQEMTVDDITTYLQP